MIATYRPEPAPRVVVCVDDDAAVLASLKRCLRAEPFDVLTTDDPREAFDWFESQTAGVLITDQRMPDLTGTQLMARVRERSPQTACILLTAYPNSALSEEALRLGGVRVLTKPWEAQDLKRLIREALRGALGVVEPGASKPS
jgi:FixJ family two-component response regulator